MQSGAKPIAISKAWGALPQDNYRRAARSLCRYWAIALLVGLAFGSAGYSQTSTGSNGGSGNGQGAGAGTGVSRPGFGRQGIGPFSNDDDYDPVMAERRMRALNTERQKQMVSDASKLLKLAKELNDEVAGTNSDSFTPDQLRKIAEIEKLARSVRERMSAAVGVAEAPNLLPPPTLVYPSH